MNSVGGFKRLVRQEAGLEAGSIEMAEQDRKAEQDREAEQDEKAEQDGRLDRMGRLNHSFVAPEKAKNSLRQGDVGMLAQAV